MGTEANAQMRERALDFLLQAILGFDDFSQTVANTDGDVRNYLIREKCVEVMKRDSEVFYHPTKKGRYFATRR